MPGVGPNVVADLISARLRPVPDFPKPGVLFQDPSPLLGDGPAFRAVIDAIVAAQPPFEAVAGIEARGFLIAAAIAYAAGGGIVPIRKAGKLPAATVRESYQLEYGQDTIEAHADAVRPGQRVLLVDDVLATGGTIAAGLRLLARLGAEVVGVSVLIELAALGGRDRVAPQAVHSLLTL